MAFSLSNLLNPVPNLGSEENNGVDVAGPGLLNGIDAVAAQSISQNAPDIERDFSPPGLAPVASAPESEITTNAHYPPRESESTHETVKQEPSDIRRSSLMDRPATSIEVSRDSRASNPEGITTLTESLDGNIEQGGYNKSNSITTNHASEEPAGRLSEEKGEKSTKHSSKNEGQHTDRRYLCYLCNKLFTRRRSVRDHISKIHNTKTWEPVRSLEVVVHPHTGDPIEPLEDIIARGPPPPAQKPPREKSEKPKAEKKQKVETLQEIPEEQEESVKEEIAEPQPEQEMPTVEEVPVQEPVSQPITVPAPVVASALITSLKTEPSVASSRGSSVEPFSAPAPVIGKKRPAPSDLSKPLSAAATKKGTAKVKSSTPNKRAKISDNDSTGNATPVFRSPSATPASIQVRTPASKLKKHTSAASQASSPTPTSSRAASVDVASPSPSASATPGSSNDDGEVFCICRKGDNHTWMIACDGGCDEWFHGNCVHIRERDGDLIDRYICPNCTRDGFITTWKRMCRRKDCRKPARVTDNPPSKYCSRECGRLFFVELVRRGDPCISTNKNGQVIVESGRAKKYRKKRQKTIPSAKAVNQLLADQLLDGDRDSRLATPAYSDEERSEYETDSSMDDDLLPNRGGALRAGEVKALVDKCRSIEEWRNLGKKPVTPPREDENNNMMNGADTANKSEQVLTGFDEYEEISLANITKQLQVLQERDQTLSSREKFLEAVKVRSSAITDEVKKANPKSKDPCGFDPRLAWSGPEFLTWLNDKGGRALLENGKIGAPEPLDTDKVMTNGAHMNGDNDDNDEDVSCDEIDDEKMPLKGGVCVKNRCPRHKNWIKASLAEIRFEQDVVGRKQSMQEATRDEILERVKWRMREMQDD